MFSWWKARQAKRLLIKKGYCPIHLIAKVRRTYSMTLRDGTVVRGDSYLEPKICSACEQDAHSKQEAEFQAAVDLLKASKNGD